MGSNPITATSDYLKDCFVVTPIRIQSNTQTYEKRADNWVAFQPSPEEKFFLSLITRNHRKRKDGYKYLSHIQRIKYAVYAKLNAHL